VRLGRGGGRGGREHGSNIGMLSLLSNAWSQIRHLRLKYGNCLVLLSGMLSLTPMLSSSIRPFFGCEVWKLLGP